MYKDQSEETCNRQTTIFQYLSRRTEEVSTGGALLGGGIPVTLQRYNVSCSTSSLFVQIQVCRDYGVHKKQEMYNWTFIMCLTCWVILQILFKLIWGGTWLSEILDELVATRWCSSPRSSSDGNKPSSMRNVFTGLCWTESPIPRWWGPRMKRACTVWAALQWMWKQTMVNSWSKYVYTYIYLYSIYIWYIIKHEPKRRFNPASCKRTCQEEQLSSVFNASCDRRRVGHWWCEA